MNLTHLIESKEGQSTFTLETDSGEPAGTLTITHEKIIKLLKEARELGLKLRLDVEEKKQEVEDERTKESERV